jgi:hypothetical protein
MPQSPMWLFGDGAPRMSSATPNVRAKGGANGVTPGPGDRKCTPYLAAGPGGTPLALPLSEVVRPHFAELNF